MYHLICFTCCELKLFVSLVEKVLNENELCLVSPKSVAICSVLGDDDSALSTPFWPLDGRGDLNRDLACLLASLEAGSWVARSWEHVQVLGFCGAGGGGPEEDRWLDDWLHTVWKRALVGSVALRIWHLSRMSKERGKFSLINSIWWCLRRIWFSRV